MSLATLILSIETSNPSTGSDAHPSSGVAIVQTTGTPAMDVIGVESLRQTGRHDDDLMPAIDRLFARAAVQPRQIDVVAVSLGPGGYTGLRVAATTANVIAEICDARVIGVPTASALIRRATVAQPCAVCLAVKGRSVWVHRFPEDEAELAPVESLCDSGLAGLVADQFLPDDIRERLIGNGVLIETPRYDPVAVAQASCAFESSSVVEAFYAREPEAVTRWRDRGARR
jgi:tRNA threonylcarbamoyl adenosine modification protein YeaZ